MQTKQSFSQKMTYWLKVVSLGIILGLGLQFAQAWTAPTLAPPNGNVGGPVTLGAGAQYKTGKLGINSPSIPNNALEVGGGGSVLIGGKAYSEATVDADLASTLATKGYVDGKVGGGNVGPILAFLKGKEISCSTTGTVDSCDQSCVPNPSTITATFSAKVDANGTPWTKIEDPSYRINTGWVEGVSNSVKVGFLSGSIRKVSIDGLKIEGTGIGGTCSKPWPYK